MKYLVLLLSLQTVDMSQTIMARNSSIRELNPILGNSIGQTVVVKSSLMISEVVIYKKLSKNHPKAAKYTAIVLSAFYVGIIVHNARQLNRSMSNG